MEEDGTDAILAHEESPPDTGMTLVRDGELTPAGERRDRYEAVRSTGIGADADFGTRGGARHVSRRRLREPSRDRAPQNTCWSIAAPKSRHTAICATCCSEIPSRLPRVRTGEGRSRVHHVGCAAVQCGPPQSLSGWEGLDVKARAVAIAQFDGSGVGTSATDLESQASRNATGHAAPADATRPGHEERLLQRMEFWDTICWALCMTRSAR